MYEDLDRPPLRTAALRRALDPEGWRVEVLAETSSTNVVVAERARAGEPEGLVVVAEQQSAGRGRLDRTWVSPPRSGLTFSVLLRPQQVTGWLPLMTGLAVARALRARAGVEAVLKWPNDVLIGEQKVCGILAEVPEPGAVVVGIGINVTTRADELPVETSTSLRLAGATTTDRDTLLRAVLRELRQVLADEPHDEYRELCCTLGREVRIELPAGEAVTGHADNVDGAGRLVVDDAAYGAGDVVHLRVR